jgi:hypothetical protein
MAAQGAAVSRARAFHSCHEGGVQRVALCAVAALAGAHALTLFSGRRLHWARSRAIAAKTQKERLRGFVGFSWARRRLDASLAPKPWCFL